ncbi:hypothetical protein CPB84DRAFT_1743964 [Gymnopilus junonius]|uniref:Uncharacterized protein n=1 Tax=Gymnopilus junonius TaxID=109634 RepID=A0A9P5NY89_GYMJU|nr:hypothetical protein CPB84DRAFT_1743964 [Gymnopilus junonius]
MSSQNSPQGSPAIDLSIAAIAAKIVDGYPATDLIRVLLRYIAIDAAKFGRDIKTSSQVYSKSYMVYNAIQDLMKKVEDSTAIDFISFDKYTTAITPLERILLEFYANSPEEKTRNVLPPADGVDSAILFIDIWESDRKMLEKALNDLQSQAFTSLSNDLASNLQASHLTHRQSDDLQMLRELVQYLNTTNKVTDRDIVNPRGARLLTSVKKSIRSIANAVTRNPPGEAKTALAIKTILISYIPFALITPEATTPTEWKEYLRSAQIWQAMESLVQHLAIFVDPPAQTQALPQHDIEEEWDKFKRLLLKRSAEGIDTEGEMMELFKLAANIRRPLHGRSVQLIRILFFLNDHSRDQKNNSSQLRRDLKFVMGESIDALGHAKEAIKDVRTIALSDDEYKKQDNELKVTLGKIGDLFKQIGLYDQWPERQKNYDDAVKVDESHLELMKKRLSNTTS